MKGRHHQKLEIIKRAAAVTRERSIEHMNAASNRAATIHEIEVRHLFCGSKQSARQATESVPSLEFRLAMIGKVAPLGEALTQS